MIEYDKVKKGDILKLSEDGAGAPGYADKGDLLRITETFPNAVEVENKHGKKVEFAYNCGAARLEPTEWKEDFPPEE